MFKYSKDKFFYYLIRIIKFQNLRPIKKGNNGIIFENPEGKPTLVFVNNFKKRNYLLNISNFSVHSIVFYLRRYKIKKQLEKLIKIKKK